MRTAGAGIGKSRTVSTNQSAVHRDLVAVVQKHYASAYRRPVAHHSEARFEYLDRIVKTHGGPLILDSGCGTGESAGILARKYPTHIVIGIDKSERRIARAGAGEMPGNLHVVHADCVDIWRLAGHARWPVERHYLLYPNPWPKAKHLRRRWHGHPVFRPLIALGGLLELRSNWEMYLTEFALALDTVGAGSAAVEPVRPPSPMTAFERKYLASGQRVYRLTIELRTLGTCC